MTILKRLWDEVFPTENGNLSHFVKTEGTLGKGGQGLEF